MKSAFSGFAVVLYLCAVGAPVCSADVIKTARGEVKGFFIGYTNGRFLFQTGSARIHRLPRHSVRELMLDGPQSVTYLRRGKRQRETARLLGYGESGFLFEQDERQVVLDAARLTALQRDPGFNPYDPNSKVDYATYDPSIDPGIDPVFVTDPALNRSEDYRYVITKPGDHTLPRGTWVLHYSVKGRKSLLRIIWENRGRLSDGKGLAIYLVHGTSLNAADVKTVQTLNKPREEGGLGLTSIDTLHIYNLKSLPGGVETKVATLNGAFMWDSGWQVSRYKHIVMDDLEEIKDGTFCDNRFHSVSFKAAKSIGVMAFGGDRAGGVRYLKELYLPSATTIKQHAFRRNKRLAKVNLPKVTFIDSYGFDDCDHMLHVNAPRLKTMGRNVFNDNHTLISVNMPRLESMRHVCFDLCRDLRIMRLPSLTELRVDGLRGMAKLTHLHLPKVKTLGPDAVTSCPSLQAVYVPMVETVGRRAFAGAAALKRINLPRVKNLDPNAFAGVRGLEVTVRGTKKVLP